MLARIKDIAQKTVQPRWSRSHVQGIVLPNVLYDLSVHGAPDSDLSLNSSAFPEKMS